MRFGGRLRERREDAPRRSPVWALVGALATALAGLAMAAAPGDSVLTVTSTGDVGVGTLRWAIQTANALPGDDTIEFALVDPEDGDGTWTIAPSTPLPAVTDGLTLLGPIGGDGASRVLLSGADLPVGYAAAAGLRLQATSTVRGLAVGGFGYGIVVDGADQGQTGAASRLFGNHLGRTGAHPRATPNHVAVLVEGRAIIGGTAVGEANVIEANAGDAVEVLGFVAHAVVRGNRITGNGGAALDLEPDPSSAGDVGEAEPNDAGDLDQGPNGLVNRPDLAAAEAAEVLAVVVGTVSGRAGVAHTIDVYASPGCDPSGYGEGARWLGEASVVPDASGVGLLLAVLTEPVQLGEAITATATSDEGTSEFSACVGATLPAGEADDPAPGDAPSAGPVAPDADPEPDPDPGPAAATPRARGAGSHGAGSGSKATTVSAPVDPPPTLPRALATPSEDGPSPAAPGTHPTEAAVEEPETRVIGAPPRPRSSLSTSLPLPKLEQLELGFIAQSLALGAALVLVLGFSSAVFNETLKANRAEVAGWFAFTRPVAQRVGAGVNWLHPLLLLAVAFAIRGIVSAFLEPGFPGGPGSGVLYLGLTIGAASLFLSAYGLVLVIERVRKGKWGRLKVVPVGWVVAVLMVVGSRMMAFVPGYMYGATMKLHLPVDVSEREAGRLIATAYSFLLVLAGSAYFARGLLSERLAMASRPMWLDVLDLVLVVIVVAGTEFTSFALLPVDGLDGPVIRAWSRKVWFAIWGAGVVFFVHVILAPQFGFWREEDAARVYVLFGIFAVATIAFWSWFHLPNRPGQVTEPAQVEVDA